MSNPNEATLPAEVNTPAHKLAARAGLAAVAAIFVVCFTILIIGAR